MKTEFLDKRLERLEQLNLLRALNLEERQELAEIKRIKELIIDSGNISALIVKAEQMQDENDEMVKIAKSNWEKEYKTAIGIGINRIVKLIKRH